MIDLIKSPRQILMDETGLPQLDTGLLNNTQPNGVRGHATGGAISKNSEMLPHYGIGGKIAGMIEHFLPLAEREANKAKFLEPSVIKERMYHGSKEPNIVEFKTRKQIADENYANDPSGDYRDERNAVFLSPDPNFTNHFSVEGYTDNGQAPTTYPVNVQARNPFDFDNPKHRENLWKTYHDIYYNPESELYAHGPHDTASEKTLAEMRMNKRINESHKDENNWPLFENPKVQEAIQDMGHDSFYIKERGTKNLGVYDPNQIKSAIGNRGTYDLNDPDINHAKGGRIDNLSPEDMMAEMIYGGRTPPRFQYDKGGSVVKWAMNEVIPMMEHLKSIGVFGNQGTCDITNPNINKAAGGSVDFPSVVEPTHMAGGGVIDKALPHVGHAFALDPMYELAKAVASSRWGHALESAGDLAQVYAPMKASLPLQLATYSPELNSNEDAELAARRAMPPLSTIKPNR